MEELDIAVLLAKLLEFLGRRSYLDYLLHIFFIYIDIHGYYIKQFEIYTSGIVTAVYFHNWTEGSDTTLFSNLLSSFRESGINCSKKLDSLSA